MDRLKKTSLLSPAERDWISGYLFDKPWYGFYWQASLDDLERGVDNRSYLLGGQREGLIMAIHFGDVDVYTILGNLKEPELRVVLLGTNRAEVHFTDQYADVVERLAEGRIKRKDKIRYYAKTNADAICDGVAVDVCPQHHEEVLGLFAKHYPETVISDWLFTMPMTGVWLDSKLVSVAGTLSMSKRLRSCHIGCFLTHPDYRGQGLAIHTANRLFSVLWEKGMQNVMLGVFDSNPVACRLYERLGFSLIETRPLIYLNAI